MLVAATVNEPKTLPNESLPILKRSKLNISYKETLKMKKTPLITIWACAIPKVPFSLVHFNQ